MFFWLICVVVQNYKDNKITPHNFAEYSYRIFLVGFSEILFDWIKNIIIFRISDIDVNLINDIALELSIFHEKLRNNSFDQNSTHHNGGPSLYIATLEKYELKLINKQKLDKYSKKLDYINVVNVELQTNILTYCIIVYSLFTY